MEKVNYTLFNCVHIAHDGLEVQLSASEVPEGYGDGIIIRICEKSNSLYPSEINGVVNDIEIILPKKSANQLANFILYSLSNA